MELHSLRLRHWGIFVWAIAFAALILGGVPDALIRHWVPKVTEPAPRSSTDSMIFRTLDLHDGTAKLRELLANTAPPQPGRTYVVRTKREADLEAVAIEICLLAWPDEVKLVICEDGDYVPQVPEDGSPARVFYLGKRPEEEVPGLRQIDRRMWFKPGNVTP